MAEGRRKLAITDSIKVVVKTPAANHPVCRGFYQVEEDSLYVPVYPAGKFFSYLDSPQAGLDIDREGRLLFLHVHTPRRQWEVKRHSDPPINSNPADIRFLGFREKLPQTRIETASDQSWLRLVFSDSAQTSAYALADDLKIELTDNRLLASIWITAIEEDRAARGMAAWRKQSKLNYDKSRGQSRYVRVEVKPSSGMK